MDEILLIMVSNNDKSPLEGKKRFNDDKNRINQLKPRFPC